MIIQLRSHVSVERVADTAMFLNSQTQTVYTFPGGLVGDVSGNTLTLSPQTTDNHINELVRHQLIESPSPSVTRRGFLGLTTATVGGGLVAISLPTVVAASSDSHTTIRGAWWVAGTASATEVDALSVRIDVSSQDGLDFDEDTWSLTFFGRTFFVNEGNDPDTRFDQGVLYFLDFDIPSITEIDALYALLCTPGSNLAFSATLDAGGVIIPVTLDYDEDELLEEDCDPDD